MVRRLIPFILAFAAALAATSPAAASLSDEVRDGQALVQQLRSGEISCDRLAADDFEHLGEYVMSRMVGSVQLHTAMNARMRSVMGAVNEERMHRLMGQRYAGCAASGTVGPMMRGMMSGPGWNDDSTWGPMMNSRDWTWMRDGNWQHMSRTDWERLSDQWIGRGMMTPANDGWHTRDYLLAGVAILLATGLVGALLGWRPWQPHRDVPQ